MRVAMISANLGAYDPPTAWPEQQVPPWITVHTYRLTDANFPPRPLAMTSRLQCGIPKWYGWQLFPNFDRYLWIDASCAPTAYAVSWFLERLGPADLAVFMHPDRRTIRDEYAFMAQRMASTGERYLTSRYKGEWLREQYEHIAADRSYLDDRLYASTAFIYRPTECVKRAFQAMWAAKARWCLHDQLYFPYALAQAGCLVRVIAESYLDCPALVYTRNKHRRRAT